MADVIVSAGDGKCHVGLAGGDGIYGGQGQSGATFVGGSGGDNLSAAVSPGPHQLYGGDGGDNISGGNAGDLLVGGLGGDSIFGGPGDDEIHGGGPLENESDQPNNLAGGPGMDLIIAGGGGDLIDGGDGDDRIEGGTGNDQLHGGPGNDVLRSGGGVDSIYGDAGNDIIRLATGCEVAANTTIHGGSGYDILESALSAGELTALNVTWTSIEEFRLVPDSDCSGNGHCTLTGGVATCACEPGWAGDNCDKCDIGFHFEGPRGTGQHLADVVDELHQGKSLAKLGVVCVADTTCTASTCSVHGTCHDDDGVALCACDFGFVGDQCDTCGPLFDPSGSSCTLASTCRADLCSGHGNCAQPTQDGDPITCACDPGFFGSGCEHTGLVGTVAQDYLVEGASVALGAISHTPDCPEGLDHWTKVSGPGQIVTVGGKPYLQLDPGDLDPAQSISYTKLALVDVPPICDDDGEIDIEIPAVPGGLPVSGGVVPKMKDIDRLIVDYIKAHPKVQGISVAIMHEGRLVYTRAFGWSDKNKTKQLRVEHLMRIASNFKPLAAAAIRRLAEVVPGLDLDEGVLGYLFTTNPADFATTFGLIQAALTFPFAKTPNGEHDVFRLDQDRHDWHLSEGDAELLSWRERDLRMNAFDARKRDCASPQDGFVSESWRSVTFNHLIDHEIGLDTSEWTGANLRANYVIDNQHLGHRPPATVSNALSLGLRMCLQYPPGERYAYNNHGYNILGEAVRIIAAKHFDEEDISAEEAILKVLFDRPVTLVAARTAQGDRLAGEVEHYATDEDPAASRLTGTCKDPVSPIDCEAGRWNLGPDVSKAYGGSQVYESSLGAFGWLTTPAQFTAFQNRFNSAGQVWSGKKDSKSGNTWGTTTRTSWIAPYLDSGSGREHGRATVAIFANDDRSSGSENLSDLQESIADALTLRDRADWPTIIRPYGLCGDGEISGTEACDASASPSFPGADSCTARGFDTGTLACSFCLVDTSDCAHNPAIP